MVAVQRIDLKTLEPEYRAGRGDLEPPAKCGLARNARISPWTIWIFP